MQPIQPVPTTRIELPNATIEVDHNLKVYFVSIIDDGQDFDEMFSELENHLKRQGYLLQPLTVPAPPIIPTPPASAPRAE